MTDAPRTRTMPTTFARLEAANKRLQGDLLDAKILLRKALMRLEGLNTLNVSIHPDVVTGDLIAEIRKLLEDAPDSVKGGEQ
jgi:hypothetical protein